MRLTDILKKKKGRFLSLDFGQLFVKIAYMESRGEGLRLINYDLKKILSSGESRLEITDFINNFLKINSISEKDAYLTISEYDSVIIKGLLLPVMPKEEILQAAKWQLKEEVPFDLKQALFHWQIEREYRDEEGTKKNLIIFIAARPEVIDKYLSIAGDCNLNPIAVTSSPFNYENLLRYFQENLPSPAILDISYKDAVLSIYKNNKLNFIRRLSFSSDKLTQSLTGALESAKGKIQLNYDEAEEIKVAFGIPGDETSVLKNNIQAIQAVSLMRPILETLVRELRFSFDFFATNFNEEIPTILYITGGGADLKNLDGYLHKELNIEVSKIPLPDFINTESVAKERLSQDHNRIISAIGAVLPGPQSVNLAARKIKMHKLELMEKSWLRIIALTVGVVFLFSLFIIRFQIDNYKNRLRNAGVYLQITGEARTLVQKISLLNNLMYKIQQGRVPVDGLLKLISTLLPGNVTLNALILDQDINNLIIKGIISGQPDTAESILAKFIEKIKASSFFIDAAVESSHRTTEGLEFEIRCALVC